MTMHGTALLLGTLATAAATSAEAPPTMAIPLLEQAPSFERFLSEPRDGPFTDMALSGPFVQRDPQDGESARFETRVYAGYDRENLYFLFVCLDDEPHLVRSRLTRREGTADYEDEMVEVRLDTFDDRRRSYYFAANPHGVQLDALWPEVGGGFDDSFDTVWHSRGERTPWGFLVMFEIPFKSLRFIPGGEQSWGLYYGRWNPRLGERSFWPPNTRRLRSQLSQMASVSGLRGISPGRNVQLIPYGSYRGFEVIDERDPSGPIKVRDLADATAGLDAKVVLKDTLSLDLTANPDFAQVESDAAQVTTNQRFEVFFPEKRPFFLENAGQFQTPLNLVFTRRIADPSLGARLTGKAGPWAIGAFAVDDQAPGERADPGSPLAGESAGIGIVRVSRDVFDQSSVGALYTERRLGDGHNRVGGVDANLQLGRNWALELQAVTSSTRTSDGQERAGPAYRAQLERRASASPTSSSTRTSRKASRPSWDSYGARESGAPSRSSGSRATRERLSTASPPSSRWVGCGTAAGSGWTSGWSRVWSSRSGAGAASSCSIVGAASG